MEKVKIADFYIAFDEKQCKFPKSWPNFVSNSKQNNMLLSVFDEDFVNKSDDLLEDHLNRIMISTKKISDWIPEYNAILMHSVVIDISGTGVAFSALSGTGKSTHLANWYAYLNGTADMPESLKRLLKDENLNIEKDGSLPELTIVNGDKPIVRFFDEDFCKENDLEIPKGTEFGVPYAYGTPWCGKEHLGCNMRTPLKHICFIERSDTNFVTKIDKAQAVDRIMQQVYMPKDPVALSKTLELVNRLINSCELWIIHCNMEPESAEVAYKAIFG